MSRAPAADGAQSFLVPSAEVADALALAKNRDGAALPPLHGSGRVSRAETSGGDGTNLIHALHLYLAAQEDEKRAGIALCRVTSGPIDDLTPAADGDGQLGGSARQEGEEPCRQCLEEELPRCGGVDAPHLGNRQLAGSLGERFRVLAGVERCPASGLHADDAPLVGIVDERRQRLKADLVDDVEDLLGGTLGAKQLRRAAARGPREADLALEERPHEGGKVTDAQHEHDPTRRLPGGPVEEDTPERRLGKERHLRPFRGAHAARAHVINVQRFFPDGLTRSIHVQGHLWGRGGGR